MRIIECILLEAYVKSYGIDCECIPSKKDNIILVLLKAAGPWSKMFAFKSLKEAKHVVDIEIKFHQKRIYSGSRKFKSAGVYLRHETKDILRLAANTHSPSRFTIIRN